MHTTITLKSLLYMDRIRYYRPTFHELSYYLTQFRREIYLSPDFSHEDLILS